MILFFSKKTICDIERKKKKIYDILCDSNTEKSKSILLTELIQTKITFNGYVNKHNSSCSLCRTPFLKMEKKNRIRCSNGLH